MQGPFPSIRYGQLLPHEKDTLITCLEKRCQFAESRLLEAEMRLSKVMVQVYRDSPRLSRCLMLSHKRTCPSVGDAKKGSGLDVPKFQTFLENAQTSEAKAPESLVEKAVPHANVDKWSSSSVHQLPRISDDKLSQSLDMKHLESSVDKLEANTLIVTANLSDGKSETFARMLGGSLPMLEKLTAELWKTKKALLTVLQEKETTRNNGSLLDIKEYEEIIKQLQEDFLLLMCQYTEIRQALQTEHPQHIVHTIGQLQDKVRKQEKIIRLQLSQVQSLKSATSIRSQEVMVTKATERFSHQQSKGENSSISNHHLEKNERNQTGSFNDTEVTSQLIQANERIRYIKAELLSSKNVINNLRSKCQMLGEQHVQTPANFEQNGEAERIQTQALYQKSMEELMASRHQLKETKQLTDSLMTKEKVAEYEHEKTRSERNFQLLSERHKAALDELQTWQSILKSVRRRSNLTSCAQEIPLRMHPPLTEIELLMDGAKSMDSEDSSLLEPKEGEQTLNNLQGQTSSQKEPLGEKLSQNVQQVDSDENCDELIDKPHSLDEKSKGLSDICQQEQSHSNQQNT
ncbi:uncharacterized protein LOC135480317 isoform X2 [Liolophura sinensis]|uniref:uncharacterized protein LOC135480317 isoform X2 n=1 Tax=Liolophura sinensis TaxID=3198878 RepID=UPI00315982FA